MDNPELEGFRIRERGLVAELFKDVEKEFKIICPHIRKDELGAYCVFGFDKGETIPEKSGRRTICDVYTLQVMCLTKNFEKCNSYRALKKKELL